MSILLPLPDESASSFALRLARREGLSLQEFCQGHLGLTRTQARSDLDQLLPRRHSRELALLAKIPEDVVRALSIPRSWTASTWDASIQRHQAPVRVCPGCLEESPHGRRFWRTHFACVCPEHGLELVGFCIHCGTPLRYFSSSEGPLVAHWLENWPTCPGCWKRFDRGQPAHPLVVKMSQYWVRAFNGHYVRSLTPAEFLRLSATCLLRFQRERRYKAAVLWMRLPVPWAAQQAAALLVHAMLHGPLPVSIFQAAVGGKFQAAQLARDLTSIWQTKVD